MTLVIKNPPASAGRRERRQVPSLVGEDPLQYSCLENPIDRGA